MNQRLIPGDIILYDGHLAVYKHSLDLIFYLIGGPSENELMLHSALIAFSDAVHMLLRNSVEKRGVLENLDLVLLCLDETIDDGCVLPSFLVDSNCHAGVQDHSGNRLDNDRLKSEQTKSRHDGDHYQRADDNECIPDGERENAAENRAVVDVCSMYVLPSAYCCVSHFTSFRDPCTRDVSSSSWGHIELHT